MTILQLAALVGGLALPQAHGQSFTVVVDYGQPLLEAVLDGRYGGVGRGVNPENFPEREAKRFVSPKLWGSAVTTEIELFPIEELWTQVRLPTTNDILVRLSARMYRPANLYELLALGEQAGLHVDHLVAALGSSTRSEIAYFDGEGLLLSRDTEGTQLIWNDRRWYFAAVRVVK